MWTPDQNKCNKFLQLHLKNLWEGDIAILGGNKMVR